MSESIDLFDDSFIETIDITESVDFVDDLVEISRIDDSSMPMEPLTDFHKLNLETNEKSRFEELDYAQIISTKDICGPAVKAHLLYLALENYKKGKSLESIYYETMAFGVGTRFKYSVKGESRCFTKENITNVVNTIDKPQWLIYVKKENSKHKPIVDKDQTLERTQTLSDPITGIKDMINNCKLLPREWTVFQVCKIFNSKQHLSNKEEHYTENRPLNLTLFAYQWSELFEYKPIRIQINCESGNIYEKMYSLNEMIDKRNLHKEHFQIDPVDALSEFKSFIGPWIALFNGKIKTTSGQKWEQTINNAVVTFCENKYDKEKQILFCLLARRLDLYIDDRSAIDKLKNFFSPNDAKERSRIDKFVRQLNKDYFKYETKYEYYPCILIVDEVLYHIPWELLNPSQEMSRVGSFFTLTQLYDKYKTQIKKGYLMKTIKEGKCVVNPDGTLQNMQSRLVKFYNEWCPNWQLTAGTMISNEAFEDLLKNSDLFCYAGHGNGLQYAKINLLKLIRLDLNCILLLYGCESLAFKTIGAHMEKQGASYFVDLCLCPAAIGALNIITDLWADLCAVSILTGFIPPPSKNIKWYPSDNEWGSSAKYPLSQIPCRNVNGSLLANLARIKCDLSFPVWLRMTIVCRGLPVTRVSKNKNG